jgi:hypothetical protein
MNGPNEKGGVAAPPVTARHQASGSIGRYHGPSHPHKAIHFVSDGQPISAKGRRAQFLRALIAAGSEGVCHTEVMPWLLNASDAAKALRDRGVRIETRKASPSRWVLRSDVQEVRP